MAETILTQMEFERFSDFFYRKTGISYDISKKSSVEMRLTKRMTATGQPNFRAYFTHLRFQASGDELQNLVNQMTVNETYFFREEYQFKCLVESVLDIIVAKKQRDQILRIWSIPSSTGEEPYSLALQLLEYWSGVDRVGVEIIASDIDTQVLDKARRGEFGLRSVQNLPKPVLNRYFKLVKKGTYRICQDLRDSIEFCHVNLNDAAQTRSFRGFDVIFCRNLLIYFDDASRRQAAESFYDALNPGGFLFLGHAETMSRISSLFRVRRFGNTIVYQKPAAGF